MSDVMIKAITSTDEIITQLAALLKQQSELTDDHIFNGSTVRGADLIKPIQVAQGEPQKFRSFRPSETFVVFLLEENHTGDDMTEAQEFGETKEILMFTSYKFKLMIYGNDAPMLSKKLQARFESEQVIEEAFQAGIHIQSVSEIESGSDFINDTFWFRRDMSINVAVRLDVSYKKDLTDFDLANTIDVIPK